MSCPTCGHTLQNLGTSDRTYFWCPRCGTLVEESTSVETMSVPYLVARCRKFENAVRCGTSQKNDWQRLGIADSIYPPEGRR